MHESYGLGPRPLGHHRGGRDGGQSHWLAHHVYAGTGPAVNFDAKKIPGERVGTSPKKSSESFPFRAMLYVLSTIFFVWGRQTKILFGVT